MYRYLLVLGIALSLGEVVAKNDQLVEGEADSSFLCSLQQVAQRVETLVQSGKFDTSDVDELLRKDPFLRQVGVRSGVSKYELRTPDRFVNGRCFTINVELRHGGTISGPKAREVRSSFTEYLEVLKATIARTDQMLRVETRETLLEAEQIYPYGLKVYERPETNNPVLKNAYFHLFRESDALPGGTAGALLDEIWSGKERTHLIKAEGMVKHLKSYLKEVDFSKEDRKAVLGVIQDLEYALNEAYTTPEIEEKLDEPAS